MWHELAAMIGNEELAERIRQRFAGERIEIPSRMPVYVIVMKVKAELKTGNYADIAGKYGLSVRTVRNYDKWKIIEGRLISPAGREYLLSDGKEGFRSSRNDVKGFM